MKPRTLLLALAAALLLGGWYLFRPERAWLDTVVDERFEGAPAAGAGRAAPASLLAMGRFHAVRHEGSGEAAVYRLGDGRRVLRLSDFATLNGPDLYVYLVAAPDALDDETVERAGHVALGRLKGNRGNQSYDIPAGVDLARYRSVTIWCRRFGVNFATAPLEPI